MYEQFDRSPHRSRIDIIESILNFLYEKGSVKKTHLLYATNLNTRSLEKYLNHLVSINAIKPTRDTKGKLKYILTPYGRHLLRLIIKLHRSLENPEPLTYFEEELKKKLGDKQGDQRDNVSTIMINDIQGISGLIYNVTIIIEHSEKYILIPIHNYSEDNELVEEISRIILYLIDTDKKVVVALKSLDAYKKNVVKNILTSLMERIHVDKKRCIFLD